VKVERTTFSVSRAAEYLDARELAAQTGQPVSSLATVALKELGDNALDASETAGVNPKLSVTVHQDSGRIVLTVSDNGTGIKLEVVERILNFNTRTSDKALYCTPSRGLQGNALKTIVGLPFALGDEGPLLNVTAHGVEHHIWATLNGAGIPEVAHEMYEKGLLERAEGSLTEFAS
jgi:DNA topoisomerase VI subunit B